MTPLGQQVGELVRRLGVKVKEVDAYHRQVEADLRSAVQRFATELPAAADLVRGLGKAPASSPAGVGDEVGRANAKLKEQLRAAEESQQRLRDQLAAARADSQGAPAGLEAEAERLREQASTAERRAADAASEITRLKSMLRQSQASARASPAPGRASDAGGLKDHYIVMEDQIEELTLGLQDAQRRMQSAEKELGDAEAREAQTQEQVLNLTGLLEKKVVEASTLQAEVYRLQRSQDSQVDVGHLQKQLKEAEFQLQQAIAREGHAEVQLGNATQQAAEAQREGRLREKELSHELLKQQEAAAAAEARLAALARDHDVLRAAERAAQGRARQTQDALDALERRAADDRGRLQRELEHTRSELSAAQTRLQRTTDQLNDVLESEHRLKIMANEAHTVAETMHDARSTSEKEFMDRINLLEEEAARAQTKIAQLRAREADLCARENALNRRLADAEDAGRKVQERLRDTQAELSTARAAVGDLQEAVANTKQESELAVALAAQRAEDATEKLRNTASRLEEAEANLTSMETDMTHLRQAADRKEAQVRELEARCSELDEQARESLDEAQKQLEEFGSHSRARDWQADALKEQLQVADAHAKKAAQREADLLRSLEDTEAQVARMECAALQKDLSAQQQVKALHLREQGQLGQIEQLQSENASLRRLINMPAEELAAQTAARASLLARAGRRSSAANQGAGPQHRSSSVGAGPPDDDGAARRYSAPVSDRAAPRSHSSPPRNERGGASRASEPGPGRPAGHDADLEAQVARLRQRMRSMDIDAPPELDAAPAHKAVPVEPQFLPAAIAPDVGGRASLSPQAAQLLQSLNAAQYTPSKHKAGATGRGYPHGRPSAGGAGQPLQPLPLELNGTPRHVEPTPLFGAGLGELATEQLDPNGISNWLI